MAEIHVVAEPIAEQHFVSTMKAGQVIDFGAFEVVCLEVHGNQTRIGVIQKPLVPKRTIDNRSTHR